MATVDPWVLQDERNLALWNRIAHAASSRPVRVIDDRATAEEKDFEKAVVEAVRSFARSKACTDFLIPFFELRAQTHDHMETGAIAEGQNEFGNYLKGCRDEDFALIAFLRLCAGQGAEAPPAEDSDVGQG